MRLSALLYLCLMVGALAKLPEGFKCPGKEDHQPPKTWRQTLETHIPNIVKIKFTCGRCTGFIVGKNLVMTAAHCAEWPTLGITVTYIDGRTAQFKVKKCGDRAKSEDNDMALLEGNTYNIEPMEIAKGCPLPQYCGSFGYGQDGVQKAVRAYGGKPIPQADNLWFFAGEIDHGDSGGPVCSVDGQVIAMQVSMERDGKPIFFTVPSCKLLEFMKGCK